MNEEKRKEELENTKKAVENGRKRIEDGWESAIKKWTLYLSETKDDRSKKVFEYALKKAKENKEKSLEDYDDKTKSLGFSLDAVLTKEKESIQEQSKIEENSVVGLKKIIEDIASKVDDIHKGKMPTRAKIWYILGIIASGTLGYFLGKFF